MTTNLTVTTALPPNGRDEAVFQVAAQYDPDVLRIVASMQVPDFRRPLALHRFLLTRDRMLARLDDAAALARTMVGPQTKIETHLVRGRLSDYLASGSDPASILVVPSRSSVGAPVRRRVTGNGRVVVAVSKREPVKSQ